MRTGREAGAGAFAFLEVSDGSCFGNIQARGPCCCPLLGRMDLHGKARPFAAAQAWAVAWAVCFPGLGHLPGLQVMVTKEVAAAVGDLKAIIPTGTSVLVEGELTETPPGTKQARPPLLWAPALLARHTNILCNRPPKLVLCCACYLAAHAAAWACRCLHGVFLMKRVWWHSGVLLVLGGSPVFQARTASPAGLHALYSIMLNVSRVEAMQKVELKASALLHVGPCDNAAGEYPLAKKKQTMEFLREIMHLRARTNTISAVARVRNALAAATHAFFQGRGFLYVHTPVITASDCEGAGEMFQVTPRSGLAATRDPVKRMLLGRMRRKPVTERAAAGCCMHRASHGPGPTSCVLARWSAARIMASPPLYTAAPFQTRAKATLACGRLHARHAGGLEKRAPHAHPMQVLAGCRTHWGSEQSKQRGSQRAGDYAADQGRCEAAGEAQRRGHRREAGGSGRARG